MNEFHAGTASRFDEFQNEDGNILFFQNFARQDCTIIRPGTINKFLPPIMPPCACHAPPILRLNFAGALVAAECFFESR